MKRSRYKIQGTYIPFFIFILSVFSSHAQSLTADAGTDKSVCLNEKVTIGGNPSATGGKQPYTYAWQPTAGLDFSNIPNPQASPSSQTSYTLTVTDSAGNSSSDEISVTVYPLPIVSAGADQTISQGTNTQLQGSGAVQYFWTPTGALTNQNSANPTAEPIITTTYSLLGTDANGCAGYDVMTLFVIPNDTIIIYNAFTPNGDGSNDVFYIGNIEKYTESKIDIFNRNGKLVFQATPYLNNWNGKVEGSDLPCATYYYVLTPGGGRKAIEGSVTIIR